jgi:hypothetical protein
VANTAATPTNTSASFSAKLIDGSGEQFSQTFFEADVGPAFPSFTIPGGDVRSGWLTFEVPEAAVGQRFQWELGDETAEWDLAAARQEPNALARPAPPTVPIGTAVAVTGAEEVPFEITVEQVVDRAQPTFGDIDRGMRFVAVQVTYHNTASTPIDEFAETAFELIDGDGQVWRPSFFGTDAGPGFDGEIKLAPADRRTGFVSFQIPTSATALKLAGSYVTADGHVLSMALA